MGYRYKFTPLAVSDIDETLDYISEKLMNPGAASNLYHAIQREISSICSGPYSFPDCPYYLIDDNNIRHSVIGNYILIYEESQAEEEIKILRFLYGGRDIAHMGIPEK